MSETVRELSLSGESVLRYTLIRKRIKNMYLRVKPDGTVEVTANALILPETADAFVRSKTPFILKRLKDAEKSRIETEDSGISDGGCFYFLGEKKTIRVEKDAREQVFFGDSEVLIRMPDPADEKRRTLLFERALLRRIKEIYLQMLAEIHPMFRRFNIPYPTVRFRAMKSRYGSCTMARKTITLNTRMIGSPAESIEYVVAHELAHFVVADHSTRFYQVVESVMPDWRARKKGLKIR